MVPKISQSLNILKRLVVLVKQQCVNLNDCLMRLLNLYQRLIIVSIQEQIILIILEQE